MTAIRIGDPLHSRYRARSRKVCRRQWRTSDKPRPDCLRYCQQCPGHWALHSNCVHTVLAFIGRVHHKRGIDVSEMMDRTVSQAFSQFVVIYHRCLKQGPHRIEGRPTACSARVQQFLLDTAPSSVYAAVRGSPPARTGRSDPRTPIARIRRFAVTPKIANSVASQKNKICGGGGRSMSSPLTNSIIDHEVVLEH